MMHSTTAMTNRGQAGMQRGFRRPVLRRLVFVSFFFCAGFLVVRFFSGGDSPPLAGVVGGASAGTRWHEGVLPARRGRLLDRHGEALAWSERSLCLAYEKGADNEMVWSDMYVVDDLVGISASQARLEIAKSGRDQVILKRGLRARQLLELRSLVHRNPRFSIVTRFIRRHRCSDARIRRQLGITRQYGRREVGISGWEKHYNHRLTGVEGMFRVQVDADGRWLMETWEEVRPPQPGFDVYVPIRRTAAD